MPSEPEHREVDDSSVPFVQRHDSKISELSMSNNSSVPFQDSNALMMDMDIDEEDEDNDDEEGFDVNMGMGKFDPAGIGSLGSQGFGAEMGLMTQYGSNDDEDESEDEDQLDTEESKLGNDNYGDGGGGPGATTDIEDRNSSPILQSNQGQHSNSSNVDAVDKHTVDQSRVGKIGKLLVDADDHDSDDDNVDQAKEFETSTTAVVMDKCKRGGGVDQVKENACLSSNEEIKEMEMKKGEGNNDDPDAGSSQATLIFKESDSQGQVHLMGTAMGAGGFGLSSLLGERHGDGDGDGDGDATGFTEDEKSDSDGEESDDEIGAMNNSKIADIADDDWNSPFKHAEGNETEVEPEAGTPCGTLDTGFTENSQLVETGDNNHDDGFPQCGDGTKDIAASESKDLNVEAVNVACEESNVGGDEVRQSHHDSSRSAIGEEVSITRNVEEDSDKQMQGHEHVDDNGKAALELGCESPKKASDHVSEMRESKKDDDPETERKFTMSPPPQPQTKTNENSLSEKIHVPLFTGETQSIPSQFPLTMTMQEEKVDEGSQEGIDPRPIEKDLTPIIQTPHREMTASKSSPFHNSTDPAPSSNDTFYNVSTLPLPVTSPDVARIKSSPLKQTGIEPIVREGEVVRGVPPFSEKENQNQPQSTETSMKNSESEIHPKLPSEEKNTTSKEAPSKSAPSDGDSLNLPQALPTEEKQASTNVNVPFPNSEDDSKSKMVEDPTQNRKPTCDNQSEKFGPTNLVQEMNSESLLEHTSTPSGDALSLSYPRDYIESVAQQGENGKDLGQKSLSMTMDSDVMTTPPSQVLLEPTSRKTVSRPSFSIVGNRTFTSSGDRACDYVNGGSEVVSRKIASKPSPSALNDKSLVVGFNSGRGQNDNADIKDANGESERPPKQTKEDVVARQQTSLNLRKLLHSESFAEENEMTGDTDGVERFMKVQQEEKKSNDIDELPVTHQDGETSDSCLTDTQEMDDEDDVPLVALRRLKRGAPRHERSSDLAPSSDDSSEDEHEFPEDLDVVEPSQTTRAIKSQLKKYATLDVEVLTKNLMNSPKVDKATEKKLKKMSKKNTTLEAKNEKLTKENEALRKKLSSVSAQLKKKNALLSGVNAQLEKKNALCLEMKERLDAFQPILEAAQKLGCTPSSQSTSSSKASGKRVSPKGKRRRHNTTRVVVEESESESESDAADDEVVTKKEPGFLTPKDKFITKERVNIVSVSSSSRKPKRKGRTQGNITFSELWRTLQEHGWKHRSGPEPYSKVYVPPNGSVRNGSKLGTDFFLADDKLWQKAEELGIIDGKDDDTNTVQVKSAVQSSPKEKEMQKDKEVKVAKDNWLSTSPKPGTKRKNSQSNNKGKGRTQGNITFSELWRTLQEHGWKHRSGPEPYSKVYVPPNGSVRNGSKLGTDFFLADDKLWQKAEELGIIDGKDDDTNTVQVKSTVQSSPKEKEMQKDKEVKVVKDTARKDKGAKVVKDVRQCTPKSGSKRKANHVESTVKSSKTAVTCSQNAIEGAEILLGMNKTLKTGNLTPERQKTTDSNAMNLLPPQPPKYKSYATKRGIKELLKFREKTARKRKLVDEMEKEPPQKQMRTSPKSPEVHLTQVPEDDASNFHYSPATRRSKNVSDKTLPLHGILFFGSGVSDDTKRTVDRLGGRFLKEVTGDALEKSNVERKLFFLSDVRNRRTHKYILACALGVPMLSTNWLYTMEKQFKKYQEQGKTYGKVPSVFDSKLYSNNRLPLGLSDKSGLFVLQRARHAKKWCRPTCEKSGNLIFSRLTIAIALDNAEFEKRWADIIRAAGAKVVSSNNIDRKDVNLDMILVDALSMPPHVTAIPSRVGKTLNRASTYHSKSSFKVVDLSWATQCIVQRTLLTTDSHERYQIATTADKKKSPSKDGTVDIYSMKVNAVRIEVGDSVTFGKDPSILYHGRVMSIKHNTRTRKNMVEMMILELHKGFELMEGGKGASTVVIDPSEIYSHIVMLGGKDYFDVSWSQGSKVFVQKKA